MRESAPHIEFDIYSAVTPPADAVTPSASQAPVASAPVRDSAAPIASPPPAPPTPSSAPASSSNTVIRPSEWQIPHPLQQPRPRQRRIFRSRREESAVLVAPPAPATPSSTPATALLVAPPADVSTPAAPPAVTTATTESTSSTSTTSSTTDGTTDTASTATSTSVPGAAATLPSQPAKGANTDANAATDVAQGQGAALHKRRTRPHHQLPPQQAPTPTRHHHQTQAQVQTLTNARLGAPAAVPTDGSGLGSGSGSGAGSGSGTSAAAANGSGSSSSSLVHKPAFIGALAAVGVVLALILLFVVLRCRRSRAARQGTQARRGDGCGLPGDGGEGEGLRCRVRRGRRAVPLAEHTKHNVCVLHTPAAHCRDRVAAAVQLLRAAGALLRRVGPRQPVPPGKPQFKMVMPPRAQGQVQMQEPDEPEFEIVKPAVLPEPQAQAYPQAGPEHAHAHQSGLTQRPSLTAVIHRSRPASPAGNPFESAEEHGRPMTEIPLSPPDAYPNPYAGYAPFISDTYRLDWTELMEDSGVAKGQYDTRTGMVMLALILFIKGSLRVWTQ
ncbi:hypothetical protein DFH09DRAFT_1275754 [Mycena vulgaris]|nr:hypothetical protein DFH09DRAFT_1275754 [Mycena vulgaris]